MGPARERSGKAMLYSASAADKCMVTLDLQLKTKESQTATSLNRTALCCNHNANHMSLF